MKQEHCANCGGLLTETNIRLAVEDAGLPQDELIFCCPSYGLIDDGFGGTYEACQGTATSDETLPAYWYAN